MLSKREYGLGIEAKRAELIRNRAELNPFNGATSRDHWAYRQLADVIGASNMRSQKLRELATRLSREFPDEAEKCERGMLRLWVGCVCYLIKHEHLLVKLQKRDKLVEINSPEKLESRSENRVPRVVFPSVQELLAAAGLRPAILPAVEI
jgi:hypothetical protein